MHTAGVGDGGDGGAGAGGGVGAGATPFQNMTPFPSVAWVELYVKTTLVPVSPNSRVNVGIASSPSPPPALNTAGPFGSPSGRS